MININIQKIKNIVTDGKKLVIRRALPVALATGVVIGAGMPKASAANIEFSNITISYIGDDEYVNETTYKSQYVSDAQAKKLKEIMANIDADFRQLYSDLANGKMGIMHTGTSYNSMARMLANINFIETKYEDTIDSLNYTEKQIIEKYLTTKTNESKLLYSSITGVSVKDLNEYDNKYSCVFANSINNTNLINIGVYEIKNNQIVSSRIISLDDSKLSTDKTLVVVPYLNTTFIGDRPNFRTEYTAEIIPKTSETICLQAMNEIDTLYEKVEKAMYFGNYNANSSTNKDAILAIYGDTNLISQSINNRYAQNSEIKDALASYLNYKQNLMVSKVYSRNSYLINYREYIEYAINNKPVRISEEQGFVYYNNNGQILLTIDRGYLKTSDLKFAGQVIKPQDQTVKLYINKGVNIYVDGILYTPKDANGNKIIPFIYNGTTYLPLSAISTLYGAKAEWKNGAAYIYSVDNTSDEYYIDENGNKVYFKNYPTVPASGEQPNAKLTSAEVTATKGINIYFDNKLYTLQPTNGNKTEAYNINGTIYVPARDISAMFGTSVSWDGTTLSAILNRNGYQIGGDTPVEDEPEIDDNFDGAYYYDQNGNKVYINEDEYTHTR